jgi:hypothetical protein
MSETMRPSKLLGVQTIRWLLRGVCTFVIAAVMLHGLYATDAGMRAVELLPSRLWSVVDACVPPADGEAAEDRIAIVLFLLCLGAAAAAVCLFESLYRHSKAR